VANNFGPAFESLAVSKGNINVQGPLDSLRHTVADVYVFWGCIRRNVSSVFRWREAAVLLGPDSSTWVVIVVAFVTT